MNSNNRVARVYFVLALAWLVQGMPALIFAQTPWDAAPALPAPLPQKKPVTRVASLPPPPASYPVGTARDKQVGIKNAIGQDGLHVPAHVAIPPSLMIDVPTGTNNSLPGLSRAPSQADGQKPVAAPSSSLVPPAFSLGGPNASAEQPVAKPAQPGSIAKGNSAKNASSFPQLAYPALPNLGNQPTNLGNQQISQAVREPTSRSLENLPLPNRAGPTVNQPNAGQPYSAQASPRQQPASENVRGNLVSGRTTFGARTANQFASTPGPNSLAPANEVGTPNSASLGAQPVGEAESVAFQPGELIAVVGTDHVLAGDLTIFVEPIIEQNRDKIPGKEQEDLIRNQLTRQVLKEYVVIKAMYQEFFRDVVGTSTPDEAEKTKKMVTKKANELFFQKRVPDLLKQNEVTDLAALEEKLREKSISLKLMRDQFIEQALAAELERKYVPMQMEVGRRELLTHYQQNLDDWKKPARAKWRQLTIRFDEHDNDRTEVDRLIKTLGNEVLDGKPFRAVAEQSSEGYTAADGGVHDFTSKGSLKSQPLDNALFTLPLARLSTVIVDDIGMHIIEVLEREDAYTVEFSKAQGEIREQLSAKKRTDEVKKLQTKVLARTPIWTKWPEDLRDKAKHVRDLSEAIGEQ